MTSDTTDEGLTIERIFDASPQLLWQAWTEPQHFKRWYGPQGIECHVCEIDLRAGGSHLFGLQMPDGNDYYTTGVYQQVDPVERFVTTDSMSDANGNVVPPSSYGMPGEDPLELLLSVTFEDLGNGRTKQTLTQTGWPDPAMAQGAGGGWSQAFDKLEAILPAT